MSHPIAGFVRLAALALLIGAGALPAAGAPPPLRNQLLDHPSPYLALHGHDPVHWQEWGPRVLERARREGKLVFISSGYFACHRCHVMQRESFSDPEVAALLNRYYVPVKVDRELMPALDARLIDFVERTQGQAGWPLNVFVTPEGYPLVGTVYLPRTDFLELLRKLQERWAAEGDRLATLAREGAAELQSPEPSHGPDLAPGLGRSYQTSLVEYALAIGDDMQGGFGDGSKFPMAPQLLALLGALDVGGEPLQRFLRLTLDQMAAGGLRDHVGGGFFRYTVDPGWHTPHYEKMLYDNALLVRVYLLAAERLGEPAYAQVARDTLDFLLREFRNPEGAFIASLSAVDEHGVEGGYYLWSDSELERILPPTLRETAAVAWGMTGPEPEAGHLPRWQGEPAALARELGIGRAELMARIGEIRQRLRQARQRRRLPRDAKVVVGWNGLMLAALTQAASLPGGGRWQDAADALARWLARRTGEGERRLRARGPAGEPLGSAGLEDHAYVAAALAARAGRSGREADRREAEAWIAAAWARFYDEKTGWQLQSRPLLAWGNRQAIVPDGPLPSPSAVLIDATLAVDGVASPRGKQALAALNRGHRSLNMDPFRHATHIDVLARAERLLRRP